MSTQPYLDPELADDDVDDVTVPFAANEENKLLDKQVRFLECCANMAEVGSCCLNYLIDSLHHCFFSIYVSLFR